MRKRKKSNKDIDKIVAFVHDKNGLKYAKESMTNYAEQAMEQLRTLPIEKGLDDFEALVEFIINRKK